MRSIPEAVRDAMETDGFLHFGLANGILNLSKTARFIQPLIETRTKKRVSVSAITMALSRLHLSKRRINARLRAVKVDSIRMVKNLAEVTYERTAHTMQALEKIERKLRQESRYVVVTLGANELTIIAPKESMGTIKRAFPTAPKAQIADLDGISVQFDEKYISQAGMVYTLIQQLTFQNINVLEFSSTYSELVFYVDREAAKLAFDTLYEQFM